MGIGHGQIPKPHFKKFKLVPVEEDSAYRVEKFLRNYDPTLRAMANNYNGMQEALYDKKASRTAKDRLTLMNSNRARLLRLQSSAQVSDEPAVKQPELQNVGGDTGLTPSQAEIDNVWFDAVNVPTGLTLKPDLAEPILKPDLAEPSEKPVKPKKLSAKAKRTRPNPTSSAQELRRSRRVVKAKPLQSGTGRVQNTSYSTQSRQRLTTATRNGKGCTPRLSVKPKRVMKKKAVRPSEVLRLY